MPRPLAAILSTLFFMGTAFVLALPVITSTAELVLRPEPFEGLVGEVSHSRQRFATLDEGATDGMEWSLRVSQRSGMSCISFSTESRVGDAGLMCTEPSPEDVGSSQFIPATDASPLSALIAGLPGNIEELRLRATDDLPIEGRLYAVPSIFRNAGTVLVAFLPPGADIVDARAVTNDGDGIDLSRLVDQVDAY
jgi:hypothetical protein